MRVTKRALYGMAIVMFALLAMPVKALTQETGRTEQPYGFSKEELTQMLAPIALYPDALAAQILMASTYPLEVVEADRWRDKNPQLTGSELDTALQNQPWDPSIKALCHFPDILSSMSEKLDQTRKLGDAFLGQEQEVMATIQELRHKAQQQGHLKTTAEQKVIVESNAIRIEPVNPEIVYVPVYDPVYVYGPWWYPAYPPYYWHSPPGFYSSETIGFGPYVSLGFGYVSWVWFDWGIRRIHIDVSRTSRFHHPIVRPGLVTPVWRHDPMHRKGVAYRDVRTSTRFGTRPPRTMPSSQEQRGYPQQKPPQVSPRVERPAVPQVRQETPGQRPSERRREKIETPQDRTGQGRPQQPVLRDTPFKGIGEGRFERRAAERGGISSQGVKTPANESSPTTGTPVHSLKNNTPRDGQAQQPNPGVSKGSGQQQRPATGRQGGGARK